LVFSLKNTILAVAKKQSKAMAKIVFKSYNQGQTTLFPASLDEKISADSPVRLLNHIVDNLNISKVIDTYKGGGTSSYHPRMLLKLVLFSYLNNIYSCRKIEKQNRENIHYMWLCGQQEPDHNTINRFRSTHLKDTINELFTRVVLLLVEPVLEQIEEGIDRDNLPEDDPPTPINTEELKKRIDQINRETLSKEDKKAVKILEEKHLPKLQEYENHLDTLGNRNSYSKTDKDATFLHLFHSAKDLRNVTKKCRER
jgi:transposase